VTSPAGIIPITYDGSDLQAANLSVFFWIAKGLFEVPTVRGEDVTVAALAGQSERNRLNHTLPIEIRGQVTADPSITDLEDARASFWDNYLVIRTLFAPNRLRATLTATLPNGAEYSISARPLNILTTEEIASEYWSGSIELEGYDDWEAAGS
jgi:hypothetical protein